MERPNVLLLLTDQQRWDTIHAGGNELIRTLTSMPSPRREGFSITPFAIPRSACRAA